MVRSVEEILHKEFGRSLSDKGVQILDPFVGTGNFITRIMQEIKTTDLPYKYANELHCNEVMLLPYYIASMNIEHAYFDRTGEYKPFPGICLVDTFDMAAHKMFTEQNAQRIEGQLKCQIFVIVGNPPYNAWQVDENDNNKNRKYQDLDTRVSETYAKASTATSKIALSDPYVKAIRWASDRIKDEGVVAFVTNSGFLDALAADGMRKHLSRDFDQIYILDLGGNIRKNPKLSGTTHNVFGIQVGVSVNLLVRKAGPSEARRCVIRYARLEESWRKEQKYAYLEDRVRTGGIAWQPVSPDEQNNWITTGLAQDFKKLPSITEIFSIESNGLKTKTNRDDWAYNFDRPTLATDIGGTIEVYNQEVSRWARRADQEAKIDDFVLRDEHQISWSETLKKHVEAGDYVMFHEGEIRRALYRPYCTAFVYFDPVLNERRYRLDSMFPARDSDNCGIWCKVGSDWPFFALATDCIPDILPQGGSRLFPFYTYAEDGTNRRENITDWALEQFRSHYADPSITKWDIFHYVYAVLHDPEYRQRYAANLRRELPRIPFVSGCHPERSEHPASPDARESKDPVSPDTQQRPREEFSARTPSENSPRRRLKSQADTRSFDSAARVASDSGRSAQDDRDIFRAFVEAGQRLAETHVHYEQQPEYPLTKTEKAGEKLDYRVTKMKLSKDKTSLIYNQFLTLSGIPPETYEYRLGNRSALEWVIDQYQVSTDKRSGITNDPNRADDPEYALRLIGQVITVSLETVKMVKSLPPMGIATTEEAAAAGSQAAN